MKQLNECPYGDILGCHGKLDPACHLSRCNGIEPFQATSRIFRRFTRCPWCGKTVAVNYDQTIHTHNQANTDVRCDGSREMAPS